MRIPDLDQMILQVEADNLEAISIESILRNVELREVVTLDIRSGLDIIELQLLEYLNTDDENPTVDLRIVDNIDKWVHREKKIDIHNSAVSLVYEIVSPLSICGRWDDYFHHGLYPPLFSYFLPISALFEQIRRMHKSIVYHYVGDETT